MFFGQKKQSPRSRQDSLSARPLHLVEPIIEPTTDGGARLRVKLKPTPAGRWLFRLPTGALKTFELDAIGLLVWNACDGKTTVQQIIRKLANQYHLNLREAEVSTLAFLQTLVKKGLIGMATKKPAK